MVYFLGKVLCSSQRNPKVFHGEISCVSHIIRKVLGILQGKTCTIYRHNESCVWRVQVVLCRPIMGGPCIFNVVYPL